MRRRLLFPAAVGALPFLLFAARTAQGGERSLLGEASLKPTAEEVTVTRDGAAVSVKIAPGNNGFPGLSLTPPSGAWDFSKYGHVEASIVNTGPKPLVVALRVDNAGRWEDNPWNTENVSLAPGERVTVRTIFGYQYGQKKGYKLDPTKVVNLLLFTFKADGPQSFRVESLKVAGPAHETPPVAPDDVRIKPKDGNLLHPATTEVQLEGAAHNMGSQPNKRLLSFRNGGVARIVPKQGRWDLRDATQVRVTVVNTSYIPVRPRVRLETNGGDSEWVSLAKPLASLAKADLVVPFGHPVDLTKPETAVRVTSDAVRALAISAEIDGQGEGALDIQAIKTELPVAKTPDWLGKRPPVPGDWTKTLDDNFKGNRLDPTVWKVTGENYYDKQTHWTKDSVIVKDGLLRIRYEKKTGFHNDDPKRNQTPYASGFLDTFGLWAQRYGYFEARMKLPRAPGLWPAFWMMPDRGSKHSPEQWKRQFTGDGAMEFDIMEQLTRWGPYRYNIAMHYDGYDKDHEALGTDKAYVEADKDGFITCGLLWTPGEAVYYCNGREVLRWKNPRISNVPSVLMFTLPMGGWDNDALDDDRLPADFIVDYVRVWQRKDLASPADGRRHDPLGG